MAKYHRFDPSRSLRAEPRGSHARGRAWTQLCSLTAAILGVLAGLVASPAAARKDGFATDSCSGCHSGGDEVSVTITPSSDTIALGQTVRLKVAIEAKNGSKGGLYLRTDAAVGTLSLVSGQPTKKAGANALTHTQPKDAANGFVTFEVDWTAPNQPGDVEFLASALSANGDGRSGGDGAGYTRLSVAFGCSGSRYFADNDLDGFGALDGYSRMACSRPERFAPSADDCEDYNEKVHPGAAEVCNARDDDCDGMIDEALPIAQYCEDKDKDGHGVRSAKTAMGCGPPSGFGLCDDDCNDADATIYPTAPELCNYRDDNCDNRRDENARLTCGVGWCRRASESCVPESCVPGQPVPEECNALDDDCDGEVDEGGGLCPAGQSCVDGFCGAARAGDAAVRGGPGDAGPRDGGATPTDMLSDASDPLVSAPEAARESEGCSLSRRRTADLGGLGQTWWLLALSFVLIRRQTRRR